MSIINITNLTFGYDHRNVFEDVSFSIDTDWKLGLIGKNGKGKTTFLRLLLKEYEYRGSINASVTFDYFPFEVKYKEKNTIDIIEEIIPNVEFWEVCREINLLEVEADCLYRPFSTLSNGEQTKVLLASLFLKQDNFFLIDEPTNHLDSMARETVSKYLKSKKGFILVSHDRELLDDVVDHILSINNSNIEIQQGNFSSWKENRDRQDNFEMNQNEKLKGDIKRLTESSRRTSNWSDKIEASKIGAADKGYVGHMAAKMMKSSKVIEDRVQKKIEEKSGLIKNIDRQDDLIIKPLEYEKSILFRLIDLSIKYNGVTACEGVSIEVLRGDRIAITGRNGRGKSSILKLIVGENIEYSGEVNISNSLKISYVAQDTSFLKGNLSDFARDSNVEEPIFKAMLNKLGFTKDDFDKDISGFSEGQKKKVLIAKSISEQAHIYVWDEPLNFIDVISKIQIEEAILKYMPTMIFVEHDKTFMKNIATKIIEL